MGKITRLSICLASFLGALALILLLPPGKAAASGGVPFGAGSTITTTVGGAYSVYAADVDGDGDTDVLSASISDDKIAWYENDGGSLPAFTGHIVTTAADSAVSVYAADVDGDGDMDVLSASWADDKIAWYENDGGSPPAFISHVITTGANGAWSVYAADVDGDGDTDVLSASWSDDKIAWYESDGGSPPAFTPHVITANAGGAYSVYAADVDGDGDLDVLADSSDHDEITWYENDGGSPPAFTPHVITDANGAWSVYAADVDGDGDLDILSASWSDNRIAWYENDGDSPPTFITHVIASDADYAVSVYAADVDGDGDIDVLSASSDDDKIAWYENDGGSLPAFTSHIITTDADNAASVHAADVDGDGDMDVLSAGGDKIAWYPNQMIHRSAVYPAQAQAVITDTVDLATSVYAADVDGDGDLDVLSASEYDDKIAWYENDGGSPPSFTSHVIATNADGAHSVHAADVDGDGDVDILSASVWDNKVAWYENDGRSPPAFTGHVITTSADYAVSVYAADVDSDGDLDVLSASVWDDKIAWYENDGGLSPAFTAHTITTDADGAWSVYAADVDGDGDVDVLSASENDKTVAWYENDGGSPPSFASHVITTNADGAHSVCAADVDSDGDLDVLSASSWDNKIAWYENDGGSPPVFTGHVITTTADYAFSVRAADVDSDGDMDVLSASVNDDKIAWYENDGGSPPAFTGRVITTNANGARLVYAADVDGDGDLDVLSVSLDDHGIAWYENLGGQFALATTDTAPATIIGGQRDDVLRIVATHRGRPGDTDAELSTLELLFEESVGDPLTIAEANNLVENLHVYRDDGSGSFEPGADTLVTTVGTLSLAAGTQTVTFADGDPNVQVAFGAPVTFFVVIELTGDAASQTLDQFRVTHVTDPKGLPSPLGSMAEDRDHDLPLALEFAPNVASSICTASAEPPTGGDAYEPDDTCDRASALSTDGTAQQHTFHQYEDLDWAHFTVVSGTTYVVQATSTSAGADLELELYDACGGNLEGSDDNAFGNDARLIFTAPSSGTYYVKALNQDLDVYGPDVTYELSVRAQIAGAAAIIVAGHNDAWQLQSNINYCTNNAYRSFLLAGIPESKLYYLNPNPGLQDPDEDDVYDDVDGVSTAANLQYGLETWATGQVGDGGQLFVYLMDHGAVDAFATDGEGDVTTPQMLDTWLHTVEDATGCRVNVIIEACHSGSFIDRVPDIAQEVSEPGRVVIASTGRDQNAYPSFQGAYFSDVFWTSIQNSSDLWVAFQDAVEAVERTGLWQTPWLDDNGNATPNDPTDGQVAAGRGLASFFGGRPPVVDVVTVTLTTNGGGVIQAQVRDDYGVEAVWAVVSPPSFQEPPPGQPFEWPDPDLPTVELLHHNGLYQRTYGGFDELGVYRVVVYARDGDGNQAVPAADLVTTGYAVYLPLVLR